MMTMNPLERSACIRREADLVLQEIRLFEILEEVGVERVFPTGSYFLNVMVYPDIDIYLSPLPVETLFRIGGQLARCEKVFQVVFEKSRDARLPGGLYLKPRVEYGDWGRPWKIDLWSLEETIIEDHLHEMQRLKEKMTEPLRETIIRYKTSLLNAQHRTPMSSGYFIYKAFLDEGMADPQEVRRYLIENGIGLG